MRHLFQQLGLLFIAAAAIISTWNHAPQVIALWLAGLVIFSLAYLPQIISAGIITAAAALSLGTIYQPQIPSGFPLITLAFTIGAWGLLITILLIIPHRLYQRRHKSAQQHNQ